MKNIYKISVALIFLAVCGLPVSCTDGYDELNTDPKLITDEEIKPELLFTKVIKESSFDILNTDRVAEYSGYIKRDDSGNILIPANIGEPFNYYTRYIENLEAIIRLTADDTAQINKHATARIWRVWVYHRMTDVYGDIPYSEVATSFEDIVLYPKYDTQESIYIDMLNELKQAAAELVVTDDQSGFGAADVMFGGDPDAWKRFANSLRLRLAVRVRYADAALAQANIADVFPSSLITANDQNATVTSEGPDAADLSNTNPLYQQVVNGDAGAGSSVSAGLALTENLLNTDDPRLPLYLEPNADMEYIGGAINLTIEERAVYPQSGKWDPYFRGATYDFNAILAAEVSFLKAEAVLAGLAAGDANALYRNGISLSMEQYAVDPVDITTFLASPAGTLSGTDEQKLEMIITQKYLAMIGDSYEAFAEHRRTGYPRVWIGSAPAASTNNALPRRFAYPLIEYNLNAPSVQEAASRLEGGDQMTSRIWWDAKPGLPFDHPKQGTFPPYEID